MRNARSLQATLSSAIALWLTVMAGNVWAQTYVTADRLGMEGSTLYTATTAASLSLGAEATKSHVWLLNSLYTGAGHKWTLDYHLTGTTGRDVFARIEVFSHDGQSVNRWVDVSFKTTATGTITFLGEDHAEARPHRIRFTFRDTSSAAYDVNATVRVVPLVGGNLGGPLRENPRYMAVGSVASPSWTTGDLMMDREDHRFMLFPLNAGQELRMRMVALAGSDSAWMDWTIWSKYHQKLATSKHRISEGSDNDIPLYTNDTGQRIFVIFALRVETPLRKLNIGFYSPQGATPAPGEIIPAPAAREINPYIAVGRRMETVVRGAGTNVVRFELPPSSGGVTTAGSTEMVRLRVRTLRTPFLQGPSGPGAQFGVSVFNGTNANPVVLPNGYSGGNGHEPGESYGEIESPVGQTPLYVVVGEGVEACRISIDATRYARPAGGDTRAPTVRITAPLAGSTITGPVTLKAAASDDFGISSVSFLVDGLPVATAPLSPYEASWSPRGLADGAHTLVARAKDLWGHTTDSAPVALTVRKDTVLPVVSFSGIREGDVVGSYATTVAVRVSDASGIESFTLQLDGKVVATGAGTSLSWRMTGVTTGNHRLTAMAVDRMGNRGTATLVVYIVTQAPVVSLTGPVAGYRWASSSNLSISFASSNALGFQRVEFYANGTLRDSVKSSAQAGVRSGRFLLAPTVIPHGAITLTLKATDVYGRTTAATVRISRP